MHFPRWFGRILVTACAAALPALSLLAVELKHPGPGSFPVGSTNFEVRAPAEGVPIFDYLNGKATAQQLLYISDLLVSPESVPTVQVPVPGGQPFGRWAGKSLPVVLYVLYPTTADNDRPSYTFPYRETGDNVFPHMQRAGEKPLLAEAGKRHPLIVYSGGYNTHGLWHLEHLKFLATHGYIVVDIFHADNRGPGFVGNLALRALTVRAVTDYLLAHPDFGPAIDPERIGVSGSSAGAHAVLSTLGGFDPRREQAGQPDPRVKAGFAVVPFMGGTVGMWPFGTDAWLFGRAHEGLRAVKAPFFAVYADKDKSVAPASVESALRALSGWRGAARLSGETHLLSKGANEDAHAWELLFFNTWLRGDPDARAQLERGTSIEGGGADQRVEPWK